MRLPCRKPRRSTPLGDSVVGGPLGASMPLGSCRVAFGHTWPESSLAVTCVIRVPSGLSWMSDPVAPCRRGCDGCTEAVKELWACQA